MELPTIFPSKLTFFTTLWYIFLFYFVLYIIFHIYIYMNHLEYTINCNNGVNCVDIRKKTKQ